MGICASQDLLGDRNSRLPRPESALMHSRRKIPQNKHPLETVALPPEPPLPLVDKQDLLISEQPDPIIPQPIHPLLQGTALERASEIQLLIYQNEQLRVQLAHSHFIQTSRRKRNKITEPLLLVLLHARWSSLTKLGINRNALGNKGCKWLSRVSLPALEKLGLRENEIDTEGMMHLSKLVCPRLAQLYLAGNRISLGLKPLAQANMPNIIYVNLENNLVVGLEINYLLISQMRHLELIDLTWNRIEDTKEKEKRKRQFIQRYCWGHILQC